MYGIVYFDEDQEVAYEYIATEKGTIEKVILFPFNLNA
jgi:hypothetical protein